MDDKFEIIMQNLSRQTPMLSDPEAMANRVMSQIGEVKPRRTSRRLIFWSVSVTSVAAAILLVFLLLPKSMPNESSQHVTIALAPSQSLMPDASTAVVENSSRRDNQMDMAEILPDKTHEKPARQNTSHPETALTENDIQPRPINAALNDQLAIALLQRDMDMLAIEEEMDLRELEVLFAELAEIEQYKN